MYSFRPVLVTTFVCLVGLPAWAVAADQTTNAAAPLQLQKNVALHVTANTNTVAGPRVGYIDGFGHAISPDQLGRLSGGSGVTQNQAVNGTVTGDTASQLTTGANAISGDTLSGAAGLPTLIQNSGNNVLIQNATVVNVQMKP